MRRRMPELMLLGLLAVVGCHKPAVREKPIPDPLLTSKKAIERKPQFTAAGPAAREELPPPPPVPVERADAPLAADVPVVQLLGPRSPR